MPADLSADMDLLREASAEAGRIAMRYFKKSPEVWMKGGASPVSEADYAVDRFLRETLLAARPAYGWLSEETADTADRLSSRRTFVVDPIDGTRGFLEGRTEWCVSVAIVEAGRPLAGVLDCPARGEVMSAALGMGAVRNGEPIRVRPPGLELNIGGPRSFINAVAPDIRGRIAHVIYIPSLAYRIAMIATGRLDATFVKANSHDWDLAAADLILHEAGGTLIDVGGEAPTYAGADVRHGALVAGSGPLLASIAGVIGQANS